MSEHSEKRHERNRGDREGKRTLKETKQETLKVGEIGLEKMDGRRKVMACEKETV